MELAIGQRVKPGLSLGIDRRFDLIQISLPDQSCGTERIDKHRTTHDNRFHRGDRAMRHQAMRSAQIVIERRLAFLVAHSDRPLGQALQGFYRALSPMWITKQVPIIRQSISNDDSVTVAIPWSDLIIEFQRPPAVIRYVID